MGNAKMGRLGAGFGLSVIVTTLLNALIVVVKETNNHVMNVLKAWSGHHWVTHGAILIILFVILGIVFSTANVGERLSYGTIFKFIVWSVIISSIVIIGFYLPNLRAAG